MFSRRTMQIRLDPQGGTVNGFTHQHDLQRGGCVCVYVCAYAGVSNTNMPPASCKQIGQLLGETIKEINLVLEKFETMSVLTLYPSKHQTSLQRFWEKIFSHTDPDFGNENKDVCQTWIMMKILQ